MCEFSSWNTVESTFEMIPSMEQDTETLLHPELIWVTATEVLDAMGTENIVNGTDAMLSEATAVAPLDASQPLNAEFLLVQDPISGNLVPMESLLHAPPECVLMNQPAGSNPATTPSTEGTETTVSSSTKLRVTLRDPQLQGKEHLVPGSYIIPQYMLQPGFPVQQLCRLDAEYNGTIYSQYILPSGPCSTLATTYTPQPGEGLNGTQKPLVKVQSHETTSMAASMDRIDEKENLRPDAISSSSSVSTAPISAKPEAAWLRDYFELQISNITIPVLKPGRKKVGTKHSRKASAQK